LQTDFVTENYNDGTMDLDTTEEDPIVGNVDTKNTYTDGLVDTEDIPTTGLIDTTNEEISESTPTP